MLAAQRAGADVPPHLLAGRPGQLAIPAGQHVGQLDTGSLPGPGQLQRAQRGLEPGPGPGRQQVGLVTRHAQGIREVRAVELVAQAQLDDLLVAGAQPGQRGTDQLAQALLLQRGAEVGGPLADGGDVVVPGARGVPGPAHLPAAFVAGHRVQPRPETARVAQAGQLGRRDHERVLHRVGRLRRIAQQGPGVRVERRGVMVIGSGQRGGITRHDRCDYLPVTHVTTL